MDNIETMELANEEDSTQENQEKIEPTDAPCLDKRKEDPKAEAGTGQGEDHMGKSQKEAETTSASTLEDKKNECRPESVGSSPHTTTGAGDWDYHTGKNLKEAETSSASTLEDKEAEPESEAEVRAEEGEDHTEENPKEESKTESVGSSQHTSTRAEDGDSTHGDQEELETTDEPCLDMEKEDLKAEADVRAGQREDHTGRNLKEPETRPVSTLDDKKDEPRSEYSNIGAGDGETSQDTIRRRKPVSQKKDIEDIGPTTTQTIKSTVTLCSSREIGSLIILMIIVGLALGFLAFTFHQFHQSDSPPERDDVSIRFSRQMDQVENQFRKQEPEFWRRTKIHLQRHLQTAEPTEPVSLILTAGLRAEKTLDCLARGLASAFSSAFNSSFLHIDGASKASQDSDQVKLDIDSKLQRAFEGGKPAAVIHRFEELPPGSTLIFYRYCDHENAAYKETFLIFTVLLEEEEEITANIRLSALEEMVDDYLKKKFLSDSSPVSYDRMDLDKYGGLWSRISHLILPVAADERIEHAGCQGT